MVIIIITSIGRQYC